LKVTEAHAPHSPGRTLGRPRSEKTRRAILKAAFQLLKRNGFDAVSMQQIACEAKVSTATLYRWWDGKEAILLDAYLETAREALPYGKRGSPLRRLRKYVLRLADFLDSEDGKLLLRLMLGIQDNPELRQAFYEKVYLPRRAEGRSVVQEAIAANELPPTVDPDLLINLLTGPVIQAALLGQKQDPKSIQRICDFVTDCSLQNTRFRRN
jgi:AcrR family transcriptional regulator